MSALLFGFIAILIATFALTALVMKPATGDKRIAQRLSSVVSGERRGDGDSPLETSQLLKTGKRSHFDWFEGFLEKYGLSRSLPKFIEQAGASTTPSNLILASLACAAAGFALACMVMPMLLLEVALALIAGCMPAARIAWKRSRRLKAFNEALPGAIDMMARALRAGHSMAAAIEMVSRDAEKAVASEFGEVFKQQNFGLPLREAMLEMLDRVPSQDLRVLVTAILVQRETGGNLVEVLDRTVAIIRERLRIHGDIRIQTAQGRMTGWILSLLPIIMLVLINMVNPGYSHILLVNPTGRKLLYVGVGLIALGSFSIHRIVNGIEV